MTEICFHCYNLLIAVSLVILGVLTALLGLVAAIRKLRTLRLPRLSPLSAVVCAGFVIAAIDCGADKASLRLTSWLASSLMSGAGDDADSVVGATEDPSPQQDDDEVRAPDHSVVALQVTTNSLVVEVVRSDADGLLAESFDVLFAYSLTSDWHLLSDACGFAVGETNVVVEISVADMPGSPTDMPASVFAEFGRHVDSDGDSLYDSRELRLYGTSPRRWDTDGDGLGDGEEVGGGLDPLSRDSDGDGYDDDEELLARNDPLAPTPGASSSIRYYYDDDDRLKAVYVGSGATVVRPSHAGNPVILQAR